MTRPLRIATIVLQRASDHIVSRVPVSNILDRYLQYLVTLSSVVEHEHFLTQPVSAEPRQDIFPDDVIDTARYDTGGFWMHALVDLGKRWTIS
jgi:hypothetical protein